MIDNIHWQGHGSFTIQGPPLIYINPWRVVRSVFHADIILIGHDHYEHCSLADIDKLRGETTQIITNELVARQIEGCTVLRPWQSISFDRASIKAVPAYHPTDVRHPPDTGGLGFIISLNYYDIYYAGDTGAIDEMNKIRPDIAILPIDNNGTMSPEEAADVVRKMRPRWAIPSNWGTIAGGASSADAQTFKKAVGDYAEVIIPTQQP